MPKDLPSSPKGFIKLARENGWTPMIRHALASTTTSKVESWGVWNVSGGGKMSALAVWEKQEGEVADSKKKWAVSMAYGTEGSTIRKMKITELKNYIQENKE